MLVQPSIDDSFKDDHGQEIQPMLKTFGRNKKTEIRLNQVIIHAREPQLTRRSRGFKHNPCNIRVTYGIIARNIQVQTRLGKLGAMCYGNYWLTPNKISLFGQTSVINHNI